VKIGALNCRVLGNGPTVNCLLDLQKERTPMCFSYQRQRWMREDWNGSGTIFTSES
jgi:hypothetical protein